jgi:flavin reductase (DIM6/NTAB) family NADH-FMN oxidoreductase RutF
MADRPHQDHDDRAATLDRDAFDALIASTDTAMVVVTTAVGDERAGCLVGFHAQCSIEPVRYAVWLSKANHTCRVALHATHLAVHLLGAEDRELAALFGELSGDDVDKFERCASTPGPHGIPLLDGCPDRIVCRRTAFLEEGSDHVCFVLEPELVTTGDEPGRRRLRLSDVSDLTPGHEAAERPAPTSERARD